MVFSPQCPYEDFFLKDEKLPELFHTCFGTESLKVSIAKTFAMTSELYDFTRLGQLKNLKVSRNVDKLKRKRVQNYE